MASIAVLNLGSGNLRSVQKALQHVADSAVTVKITDDPNDVARASHIVFPGQGAIGACMRAISDKRLHTAVMGALKTKPFLGICLGLQALYDYSEENGGIDCLGVLRGRVRHFRMLKGFDGDKYPLKIPHMGWNTVQQTQPHPLWENVPDRTRFYFVHSYCVRAEDADAIYGVSDHGESFTAAGGAGNIFAVQFHPEKSQQQGLQMLRNFVNWTGGH